MTNYGLISIIVLNWNGKTDTVECINSLQGITYKNYTIIVVDNGSTDDSVDVLKNTFNDIVILETGTNLGYAGGNNIGIEYAMNAGAEYIFLLNNDTIVAPDILDHLLTSSSKHPKAAVLGAQILFYDEPNVIWCNGGEWSNKDLSFKLSGYREPVDSHNTTCAVTDYVCGCAFFVKSDRFMDIGLLDDDFFLTYEETDWCYRAKQRGYVPMIVNDAKVWHKISVSFGGNQSPLAKYFMTRNKLLWAKKHLPIGQRVKVHWKNTQEISQSVFSKFSISYSNKPFHKALIWSIASWIRSAQKKAARPDVNAAIAGTRDYYLHRFGDCPDSIRTSGKK